MRLSNRVEKLEREAGCAGGVCVVCERRAASVEASPVMRFGFVENPGDTYELNCPGCGSPFTLQVVYVEQKEAA